MAQGKEKVGRMDRRMTIQRRTLQPNGYGEQVEVWADLVTVWAKVDYPQAGSNEEIDSGLQTAYTRCTFSIRWRSDLEATDRIRYYNEIYDVTALRPKGRNDYIEITATKRE